MIDLNILERRGCSAKALRPVFEAFELQDMGATGKGGVKALDEKVASRNDKIGMLRNRIRSRVQSGRDWNFSNYKTFHALDIAWNTPFKQISPTLLQSVMGADGESADVQDKLKQWGFDLSKVIEHAGTDPKTGKAITRVNVPAFFQIFVPLVRAYVTMRWAKIVNDRRLIPFMKFEPAVTTKMNRVRCEVLTNRIEVMARQMGYYEIMKQSVFQMLHYGFCLKFPQEQWWTETQEIEGDGTTETNDIVPKPDMEATATTPAPTDNIGPEVVVKEGIRHKMPHPARVFWDQAHRISTFNSDTGCEYAGYWTVTRYKNVVGNSNYWCTDKVGFGTNDWWNSATGVATYWKTVFRGCTMNWPTAPQADTTTSGSTGGNHDRETRLSFNFYNNAEMGDMACTLTEYFEKLIPSEWGLGDYNHPVWFRFVVAGDTATIIYAAPLPYCPVIAYVYDADENRDINSSLSLEVLPFQDQFSNLMTQYLLTVQRNLDNATFIDKDQVDEDDIRKIENAGERLWRARTFIRYSNRKNLRAQQSIPNAVYNAQFQQLDGNSIVNAMKVLLDTLERVLVMSSQEVAQAATHEQTREEVKNIQQSQSTRLMFTQTPVDLASEAWKRQIYAGTMAYGSEEFYSYVAYDKTITPELLKELGFTTVEEDSEGTPNRRVFVKGSKAKLREKRDARTAIMLEAFAATRDNNDRVNDSEGASAIMQLIMTAVNTEYGVSLGGEQFIDILNQVGRRTGVFDRDFKLACKFDPTEVMKKRMEMEAKGGQQKGPAQGQPAADPGQTIMPMLQMLQQQIMQQVGAAIKPMGDAIQQDTAEIQGIGKVLKEQLAPAIQQAMQLSQRNATDIQHFALVMKSLEEFLAHMHGGGVPPGIPPAPPAEPQLQPA